MIRIVVFFCLLYLCQCSVGTSINNVKLRKISVFYSLPYIVKGDSVALAVDSGFIYYWGKYRVYEIPVREAELLNGELVFDSLKSNFMGFDTSQNTGYYVQKLEDTISREVPVDSVLEDRPSGTWVDSLFSTAKFRKAEPISKTAVIKVYSSTNAEVDSLILYFDRSFSTIPFAISPNLDRLNNSKLYKAELVLKKDISEKAEKYNRYRRIILQLGESKAIDNRKAIINFLRRLEKKYKEQGV